METPPCKTAGASPRLVRKVSAIHDLRKLSRGSAIDVIDEPRVAMAEQETPKTAVRMNQKDDGDVLLPVTPCRTTRDLDEQDMLSELPSRLTVTFTNDEKGSEESQARTRHELSHRPISTDFRGLGKMLAGPLITADDNAPTLLLSTGGSQAIHQAQSQASPRWSKESRDSGYYSIARSSIAESPKGLAPSRRGSSPRRPHSDLKQSPRSDHMKAGFLNSLSERGVKRELVLDEDADGYDLPAKLSSMCLHRNAPRIAQRPFHRDNDGHDQYQTSPWVSDAGRPVHPHYAHNSEKSHGPDVPIIQKQDLRPTKRQYQPSRPLLSDVTSREENDNTSVSSEDSGSTDSTGLWPSDDSEAEEDSFLPHGHPYLKIKYIVVAALVDMFLQWRRSISLTSATISAPPPSTSSLEIQDSKRDTSRKRRREGKDKDDDDERDGKSRGGITATRKRNRASSHTATFACPFLKKDKRLHRNCARYSLSRIRDVKQHLSRCHQMPIYCGRCGHVFSSEASRDSHLQADEVCTKAFFVVDGVTTEQFRQLAKKSNASLSWEQQWYAVFDLLFPGHQPRPESPYASEDIIQQLLQAKQIAVQQAPGLVEAALRTISTPESPGLNVDRDWPRLITQIVSTVLDEAFDIVVGCAEHSAPASVDGVTRRERCTPSSSGSFPELEIGSTEATHGTLEVDNVDTRAPWETVSNTSAVLGDEIFNVDWDNTNNDDGENMPWMADFFSPQD